MTGQKGKDDVHGRNSMRLGLLNFLTNKIFC